MLLSKKAMKKANMKLDLANDKADLWTGCTLTNYIYRTLLCSFERDICSN